MTIRDMGTCRCELCGKYVYHTVKLNGGYYGFLCVDCDLVMTDMTYVTSTNHDINVSFYPLEERVTIYYSRRREFEQKYKKLLGKLESYTATHTIGSVLEIGSNIGFLSHYMDRQGFAVTSVEINDDLRAFQNLVYGIVSLKNMDEIPSGQVFDAIILMDVLEHIERPVEFLRRIISHLHKDGIVFIQFPNKNSLSARLAGCNWGWWQAPDHRFHFSERAVKHIADKTGLEICSFAKVSPLLDDLISLPYVGKLFIPLQVINRCFVLNKFVSWCLGSMLQVILHKKT